MFANLLDVIAGLLGALVLIPYRMYARLTEKGIERRRNGGWTTGFGDQQRLNMATDMAIRQGITYTLVPVSGDRAVRAVRAMGF